MIRNLTLIFIFCCCLSVAHGQDVETDGSAAEQTSAKQSQEKAAQQEQQKKKSEAPKPKPPKEVFKPSEEISEDSPVPFPVDI